MYGLRLTFVLVCILFAQGILAQNSADFTLWSLDDSGNCAESGLFLVEENGFRLKPDWEVERIEYLYEWWGYSPSPVFDYEILERNGETFQNGENVVEPALVRAFIESLQKLHQTHQLIGGISHTDDYPSWTIELRGTDGEIILLSSDSTANAGHAPWNIYYEGCFFAQLDGSLAEPLAALFQSEAGSPAGAFYPGGFEEGMIYFSTEGWPPQLTMGYTGLVPLSHSFSYRINADTSQITGQIKGRSSIAGLGNMVIGSITDLDAVTLLEAETEILCTIEVLPSDDPLALIWDFACPLSTQEAGTSYSYPIQVSFRTDMDETFEIEGVLEGQWGNPPDFWRLSEDEFIRDAFMANADIRTLLETHHLAFASYSVELELANLEHGTISGQAVLLGETLLGEESIRYTIATTFTIEDGTVTAWRLSMAELEGILSQILSQPVTRRAFEADKRLVLNLAYIESDGIPENERVHWLELRTCSSEAINLPNSSSPAIGFSFNSNWGLADPQFVLSGENELHLGSIRFWPRVNNLSEVFIPEEISSLDLNDFETIQVDFVSRYPMADLYLVLRDEVSAEDAQSYLEFFESLGASVELSYDVVMTVDEIDISIDELGAVHIVACQN